MGGRRVVANVGSMAHAAWTYELPATGSFAENLDDYEARIADGGHLGVVTGLVERDGAVYVLVDAGRLPPLVHRRLAFRIEDVAEIDHDALVVTLALARAQLTDKALALDPLLAVHGPGADAVRVHDLGVPPAVPGTEGPTERIASLVALAAAALSAYALLVVVAVWAAHGLSGWQFLAFALPALIALVALVAVGYRLYREPHAGHHARPPSALPT
jgi:hypothetical protein